MQRAVLGGAARSRSMAENLRRVVGRQLRPARRFAERAALRTDGDPGVFINDDLFDADDERIATLGAFEPDRPGDGVGVRRIAIEARPQLRVGAVLGTLEVAGAGVPGFHQEAFAGFHFQQGLVFPVEGVLAGQVAGDLLHGGTSRRSRHHMVDWARTQCPEELTLTASVGLGLA